MKKIIATFLAVLMLFSVVSAAGAGASGGGATAAPTVERPTATITVLNELELADEIALTHALNFKADAATDMQLETYGDWYADFVFTVNKNVTFNGNGEADGYLAGQYDAWSENWVKVPFKDMEIEAYAPVKIMETAAEAMNKPGLKYTYAEVYDTVKDFDCGVYFSDEFIKANPDVIATLELRIYNPKDESEYYSIGDMYEFLMADIPTATVTQIDTKTIADEIALTYALNFKVGEVTEDQLNAFGDWNADFFFTVNKDVTFNANGEADGYLAGQYDAWSENWVSVPTVDTVIEADVTTTILTLAAQALGRDDLKVNFSELVEYVKDFDCGVYFTDAFLKANPDLEVTIELFLENPNGLESYIIGDGYTFTVKTATSDNNVTVQGTQSTSNSVTIQDIDTGSATLGTKDVTIDTNDFVDSSANNVAVDTLTIPVASVEAVENLGDDATLNITLANDAGDIEVSINKDALSSITDAANDAGSSNVILKVEEAKDGYLTSNQDTAIANLDNVIVYTVSFETEDGTPVYSADTNLVNSQITIKVPYTPSTIGAIIVNVKHLKDDGTLEDVTATYSNGIITMYLPHFSDYVIYETAAPTQVGGGGAGGGGGGLTSDTPTEYTITFDSNGGSAVASQVVERERKVSKPVNPTKNGYVFKGWYLDKGLTNAYNFELTVTKDFTLYAKWESETAKEEAPAEDTTAKLAFTDVKDDAWYYNDVKYVNDNKLMNGTSATSFAPTALLTRAMLVTILYRNEGEPVVSGNAFADVKDDAWYSNAVKWAKENSIVNGVSDTSFAPNANITREQIAAIMFRYANYKGKVSATVEEKISAFADADKVSTYAKDAFNWAVGTGLINGKGANTLAPKDNATRAEIAAILHRYLTK